MTCWNPAGIFPFASHLFHLLKDLREKSDCFYSTEYIILMNEVSIITIQVYYYLISI